MSNSDEHFTVGGIAGLIILLIGITGIEINLGTAIGAILLSAFGALVPDILEPATGPNHRSLFHSFTALFVIGFFTLGILSGQSSFSAVAVVGFAAVGHISHLVMDARTKKGLPAIV
jgi:membrane-bound metal-dependent hydrolase YbcI (DUF457 family)